MNAKRRYTSFAAALLMLLSFHFVGSSVILYSANSGSSITVSSQHIFGQKQREQVAMTQVAVSQKQLLAEITEEETEEKYKQVKLVQTHAITHAYFASYLCQAYNASAQFIQAFNLKTLNTTVPRYLALEVFRL